MDVDIASPPAPSPWRTVWFSPRVTVRAVLAAEPRPSWTAVVALAALHQIFAALQVDPGDGTFSANRSAVPAILGPLQIVYGVLMGPFVLAFVGSWLGGDADPEEIRHAVVWSYVPCAVAGLLWIPILLAFGGPPGDTSALTLVQSLTLLLGLGILLGNLWTVVLQVVMFAEVEHFAIWRAIVCLVILLIPVLLVGGLS